MRYRVHPDAAGGVIQKTKSENATLREHGDQAVRELLNLGESLPHSPVVASALSGLAAEVTDPTVDALCGHVENAATSTGSAVCHYQDGDREMGLNAQTNSGKAPNPQMPGGRR